MYLSTRHLKHMYIARTSHLHQLQRTPCAHPTHILHAYPTHITCMSHHTSDTHHASTPAKPHAYAMRGTAPASPPRTATPRTAAAPTAAAAAPTPAPDRRRTLRRSPGVRCRAPGRGRQWARRRDRLRPRRLSRRASGGARARRARGPRRRRLAGGGAVDGRRRRG